MPEATEEDWFRRHANHQYAVLNVKASPECVEHQAVLDDSDIDLQVWSTLMGSRSNVGDKMGLKALPKRKNCRSHWTT